MLLIALLVSMPAFADNGLVSVASPHPVDVTMDRLGKALEAKGMTLFIRVDHAAGAHAAGLELRPTELLVFGNPKVGTALMQCQQLIGIDLPLKMLAWEDASGKVWLSYTDPAYLADRHAVDGCDAVLGKVGNALASFAKAATVP